MPPSASLIISMANALRNVRATMSLNSVARPHGSTPEVKPEQATVKGGHKHRSRAIRHYAGNLMADSGCVVPEAVGVGIVSRHPAAVVAYQHRRWIVGRLNHHAHRKLHVGVTVDRGHRNLVDAHRPFAHGADIYVGKLILVERRTEVNGRRCQ